MLKVIKIGGNIVDNPEKLDRFLKDLRCCPVRKFWYTEGVKWPPRFPKRSVLRRR